MLRNFLRIQRFQCLTLTGVTRAEVLSVFTQRTFVTDEKNFAQAAADEPKKKLVKPAHNENIFLNDDSDDKQALNVQKNNNHVNPFGQDGPLLRGGSSNFTDTHNPFQELTDEEREKRLKVLQLEVDIANQEGRRVPQLDFFKDHHWQYVLTLPSRSARIKYYAYLWQIEMKKEARERKKIEKAEEVLARKELIQKENEENSHIIYGLTHTTLFLRIYDSTITHWQNNRLIRAMQFSPQIVLDCSYDQYMTKREAANAAKQLMLCFAENRLHDDPFDLHYCNVNLESVCIQGLKRYIPTMLNPEFPMNIHEQCFTKIFPKENLVYLTPHCRKDLEEYNPDDVYIVGAMVDTVNNQPLSLAKAKKLGIRMARLPLDRYLQWGAGSGKSLTINQMIKILLDIKSTGDWEKSLKHVPRRKIVDLPGERRSLERRAEKFNINIKQILDDEDRPKRSYTSQSSPVRSYKDDLQFKLETWGSKKKRDKF